MEITNKPFVNEVIADNNLWGQQAPVSIVNYQVAQALLSPEEVSNTLEFLGKQTWIPVGLDGIKDNYQEGDRIGSYRLSVFSEQMADALWKKLERSIERDGDWKPVGINPLFRFIKYQEGGNLVPHYDAPYCYHDKKMTRKSLVIYLTDNTEGFTDFLYDDQLDAKEKDYRDREGYSGKTLVRFIPSAGAGLMFDHRMIHEVTDMKKENKIIIRTDIIYEKE